jgi:hypothetical protein
VGLIPALFLFRRKSQRREQGTGNREQGTGNREQGTGNREQGTGNREQGTGNRFSAILRFFTQFDFIVLAYLQLTQNSDVLFSI